MRKRLLSVLGVLALLGLNSNQAVTRGYFYSNIGTAFTWAGSAQTGWNGSTQAATCTDYTTYIKNDGTACPAAASGALVQYGFATTHAVNTAPTHSPILANNTFSGGNFSSWTTTNASACTGSTFTGASSSDEDGDNGYAYGSSAGCYSTAAQITLSQTFTTGGAPTSQTYSFWYNAPPVTFGDAVNCSQGTGAASLSVKIGATVIATPTLTLDGNWHQVSGTTTAMVSGSNTITFTATLTAASGQLSRYNSKIGEYTCSGTLSKAQTISIDNVVLTGVW